MRAPVLAALLVVPLALAACTQPVGLPPDAEVPAPAVRFIVLGDQGTGGEAQYAVAQAMERVCLERGCDFAVALGDNIYPAGPKGPDDPQFDEKFERPYANLTFPFWMALGNHDNSEDPAGTGATGGLGLWYQAGEHEVAYAKRTDRASEKWMLPDRHYTFHAGGLGASHLAGFVALDTNTLLFHDVAFPPEAVESVQKQSAWVDGAVAAVAAGSAWTFAFGHHGYISNGPHGDAGSYDGLAGVPGQSGDYAKAFFEEHICGLVDVYLFGHDHDLQWLEPVPSCGATHFIGSGGGGAGIYGLEGTHPARFQAESHGFWWIEVEGDAVRAMAFDDEARLLFEDTLLKDRPARAS